MAFLGGGLFGIDPAILEGIAALGSSAAVSQAIGSQDVPGSQFLNQKPVTFGQAGSDFADQLGPIIGDIYHKAREPVQDWFKSGPKKQPPPTPAPPTAKTTTPTTPPANPDDVFKAGLGMFFSQYLAPMMQQISNQNNSLIGQYGNMMNEALKGPLPAGVASTMKAFEAQNMQLDESMNNAAMLKAGTTIPFTLLLNQLGQSSQAQQTLAQALQSAAAQQLLGTGNTQGLAQMIANMGGNTTMEGVIANALLNSGGFLQNLLGSQKGGKTPSASPSTTTSSTPQTVIVQPQANTPGASIGQYGQGTQSLTPSAADTGLNSLASQAAMALLANQQGSAAAANNIAGTGYTGASIPGL